MIISVTLNPAVDEEYLVPEFHPGGWFRASNIERSAGGRGINVSTTLSQMGYESAAMGFLAGFNGEYIRDVLRKARVTTNFVHVPGETRNDVYIVDGVGHVETGIVELGPYIPEESLARFMTNYERMLHRADLVCMGGSLPPGVPQDIYRDLVRLARGRGVPTFIDASGSALMAALEASPTLAKVDDRFGSRIAGVQLTSLDSVIEAVSKLHDQGVEYAVVPYRTNGELFFTPEGIFLAEIDRREIISRFGMADALIAGLIIGHMESMNAENRIRFAMACAISAGSHMGKGIRGGRDAVKGYMERVHLEKLEVRS